MPTKPTSDVRSAGSQRDNRWVETVYDQHKSKRFPNGRPWWGYMEYPTDKQYDPAFVCELMPGDHQDPFGSTWSAPWYPPQTRSTSGTTFRLDVKNRRITWLYSSVIGADREALTRYYQAAAKIAHQNGWPAPALGEPVSFQIESILLDAPRSPKIAEAALAGDRWILGDTEEPNVVLADLLAGLRPMTDTRQPLLTVGQVLGDGTDIAALIAKAVADALAAQSAANKARIAKARSARRGGKHGVQGATSVKASTAAPVGAPV